jgi:hypothetical protein
MTFTEYLILAIVMLAIVIIARKAQQSLEKKEAEAIIDLEEGLKGAEDSSHVISYSDTEAEAEDSAEAEDLDDPDIAPDTAGVSEEEAEELQEKLMADTYAAPKNKKKRQYRKSSAKRDGEPGSSDEKPKKRTPRKKTKKNETE